jgi:hypothetical protein
MRREFATFKRYVPPAGNLSRCKIEGTRAEGRGRDEMKKERKEKKRNNKN